MLYQSTQQLMAGSTCANDSKGVSLNGEQLFVRQRIVNTQSFENSDDRSPVRWVILDVVHHQPHCLRPRLWVVPTCHVRTILPTPEGLYERGAIYRWRLELLMSTKGW